MSIIEIFEKVNLRIPMEQRVFFNHFNDTVDELVALYHGFVFEKNANYQPIESVNANVPVLPLYASAIVDNILFLAGADNRELLKNEFLRKSHDAYLVYWNENAKGRKIKSERRW